MEDERRAVRHHVRPGRSTLSRIHATAVVLAAGLAFAFAASAGRSAPHSGQQERPTNTSPPTVLGSPAESRTLRATTGGWAGSATASYSFQWQRCNREGQDCRNISGATSSRYVVAAADVGYRLRIVVQAANSAGSGNPAHSAATAVVTGRPRNTSRPTISGSAVVGQTLSAGTGSWAGSTTARFSYQWQRCDQQGRACGNISGATSNRYGIAGRDVGSRLRVVVQAANSAGSSRPASSPPTAVVAGRPFAIARPAVSGAATIGQTLSATTGTWAGSVAGYSYQWQRCDQGGASCSNIAGATSGRYVVAAADVGRRLRVVVQATNSYGPSAPERSAATPTVGLGVTVPQNTSNPTVAGSPAVGQTLSATTGTWAGSSTANYSFQWQRCDEPLRNCTNIPGAGGNRYVVAEADVRHRLRVVVQASNAAGTSAPVPSAPTDVVQVQGVIRLPGGRSSVPAASVSQPHRLVIDRVRFRPSRINSRTRVFTARFHVSDTRGFSVRDALVLAAGVPFNRISAEPEVRTRVDGWATVRFRVRPTLDVRRTSLIVMFVRARKQGDSVLAGVSTRRLVAVRVARG
jgi:hypothetical protein